MEFSMKSLIFSVIVLLVIGGAGLLFFDAPVSYILIAIAVIAAVFVFIKTSSGSKNKKKASPQSTPERSTKPKKSPEDELKKNLLKLNIDVRTSGIPHIVEIETVIDQLIELIPHMKARFPDKEITWQTEKIASGYLPDIINAFLKLNIEKRKEQSSSLLKSINALKRELKSIEELTSSAQIADFDMKANEISLRFSNLLK